MSIANRWARTFLITYPRAASLDAASQAIFTVFGSLNAETAFYDQTTRTRRPRTKRNAPNIELHVTKTSTATLTNTMTSLIWQRRVENPITVEFVVSGYE